MLLKMESLKANPSDSWILWNGKLLLASQPIVSAANRGLRYGDGIFETILWLDGQPVAASAHFQRFFSGLIKLGFSFQEKLFNPLVLQQQMEKLVVKNKLTAAARIRLMAFRGDGGLYDPVSHQVQWTMEATPLPEGNRSMNENGLVLGVYQEARKVSDVFSSLKNNNFLPYVTGALAAKVNRWNDALLLNPFGRVADSTIANIWWVEGKKIFTPPLSDGPVAGTRRKILLDLQSWQDYSIEEASADPQRLRSADSIFLTNAIYTLRWVSRLDDQTYLPGIAPALFQELFNQARKR